jgi:hypothetical protein
MRAKYHERSGRRERSTLDPERFVTALTWSRAPSKKLHDYL